MNFRKSIALLIVLSSVFMNFSVYAAEAQSDENQTEPYNEEVLLRKVKDVYEDFEDYTGGSSNLSIYLTLNGAKAVKGENPLLDGTSICMSFEDVNFQTLAKAEPFLYYTYPTGEDLSWKADVCFEGTVPSGGFVVVAKNSSGGNVYLQNVNFSNGDLVINNLKTEGKRVTLSPNTKYSLEYAIDTSAKTLDFYVNDELVADDYKLQADFASIHQLRLITSGNSENHGNIYLDNFTIYKFTDAANIVPEISWDAEDEIDLNNITQISVNAKDSDGDIEKIEFFCDGELIDTKETAQAVFDISEFGKGEHIIKAVAYDNEGAKAEIEKKVNFVKNEIELITVSTNLVNDSYDISELDKIEVTVEGNTAEIEKVTLYIDGEKCLTDSVMELSSDYIPTGEHEIKVVVFDADMNKGTWKKSISFTENTDDIWYENDFSAYSGGNAVTGLAFNATSGLTYSALAEVIDDDYGNSIYFDIDEEKITTETVDVGVWYNANTDKSLKWKASMYFDAIPENVYFQVVGPNSSGSNVYMSNVIIKNGAVTASGNVIENIEVGKFYDFEYMLDMENQKYSFSVNGEKLVNDADFTASIASVNTLRLVTNYKKGTPTGFAIDNVSIGGSVTMPYILSSEQVDDITLSFEMTDAESVELSDITVYDSAGNVEITNILKENNRVFLTLKNPLRNDTKYSIYVTPSVLTDGIKQYGRNTVSSFVTGNGEYGVSDVNFRIEDGSLISEALLYNNTTTDRTALIVLNIYKENKIVDSKFKSVTLKAGMQDGFELTSDMYDNSAVAKVFVLNSWQDRSAFCNNLFKY